MADSCAISVDRRLTFGEDKDLAISQIENLPSVKAAGDKAKVSMYTYEVPSSGPASSTPPTATSPRGSCPKTMW